MPPRPKRRAPDCQLSARDSMVLKSWQTGAWTKVSLASGRAGQLVPAPLPPRPARPEARATRPPRPVTTATPPVVLSLRSGCVMKDASDSQPQEQLYIAAQRPHRRPLTQDPRCWRPLNITASCGREPVAPVTLAAVLVPGPQYQRSARASRSCILHATPLTTLLCQSGGVAAHPPHMLAPSIPGGCATARAACAASQCATSSPPDTADSRRHHRRRRHLRHSPP